MPADQQTEGIRKQWETAAEGWARWEPTIAKWMAPATEAMLEMARVTAGSSVLDMACGAGNQTLLAARRIGAGGRIVANDLADTMLRHVRERARAEGYVNVETLLGPAEAVDVGGADFDACICHLGLMLFAEPARALTAAHRALRPGGWMAAVVFTTPDANAFMAEPMRILLGRTGKAPPAPGHPGIFALGAPGQLEALFRANGFTDVEQRTLAVSMRTDSAATTLTMMQDAFGAYRAVLADSDAQTRAAAWAEVGDYLRTFEHPDGFAAPGEVRVVAGARPG